ncbi:hypothetical protein [Actinoplanes couchii]|uniref:GGDEF domain-containing protein n=1 Tax=Actinoplanes couchii TaxID=403638 RepID=A0ABQ3XKC5_9ACTN|nr:hypothetical protein [Actinoplanes couchii]MDR6320471.1 hypothetical protein [Actinoplanes couchii]GID58875.1 hypothetical protein Aco03nite_072790 [Actinoplanes couchii]
MHRRGLKAADTALYDAEHGGRDRVARQTPARQTPARQTPARQAPALQVPARPSH